MSEKTTVVHMYQEDISGKNAIDIAFEHNSIFCIKAFVDSLLQLTSEKQFRNSFDKALLMMINKGINVCELVTSDLFYPPIWTEKTIFSENQEICIEPYNNDINDLEHDDPNRLFIMYDNQFKITKCLPYILSLLFKDKEATKTTTQKDMLKKKK